MESSLNTARGHCWRLCAFVLAALVGWHAASGHTAELTLRSTLPPPQGNTTDEMPDQLPQSRAAHGLRDVKVAWLAGPTDRYRHGVLGDDLEAGRLAVHTRTGKRLIVELASRRVFEDLEPRLVDIDGDGRDEITVVESDAALGASLAVYGIVDGRLVRLAATSFLGQPYRWLNPLGVGDFDGDGRRDIALVATPHIGGILRLYRFTRPHLSAFAEYPGVSTHRIGSTELGLGRVVANSPRDRMLVPDRSRRTLMMLEWAPEKWRVIARTVLPGRLGSSLMPAGDGAWRFQLEEGGHYEVQLTSGE